MTVGQELMKITGLRLFHNHMTIEPVMEIFGRYDAAVIRRLREVIFEEYAVSGNEGLIFTYMWAFNLPSEIEYLNHVCDIFRSRVPETEFYCVELVAPQEIRLQRNLTENRLKNKASKNDIAASTRHLLEDDEKYRMESLDGEVPFPNYLRIDNSDLPPAVVATQIKEHFSL